MIMARPDLHPSRTSEPWTVEIRSSRFETWGNEIFSDDTASQEKIMTLRDGTQPFDCEPTCVRRHAFNEPISRYDILATLSKLCLLTELTGSEAALAKMPKVSAKRLSYGSPDNTSFVIGGASEVECRCNRG